MPSGPGRATCSAAAAGAVLVLLALPGRAEPWLSGCLKDIADDHRTFLDDQASWENLSRLRLQLDLRGEPAGLFADFDQEVLTGSYLRTLDRRVLGLAYPPTWLDLQWTTHDGQDAVWRDRFYRLYAEASGGDWSGRAGRQTVAWGTGKIWNPTDVLNPYQPLTLERDERQGVDAFYARRELGTLSRAEAVYAPMSDWSGSSALGRLRGHAAETDVSLMGGKPPLGSGSWIVGGDAARDVGGSDVHAEGAYLGGPSNGWRWVAGIDRSLESPSWLKDAWVLAEYFHNGPGAASFGGYDFAALLTGRTPALARDYVGAAFRDDVHPLLRLEAYVVWNLDDGSSYFGPDARWNVLPSLDLTAGWQHFAGGGESEFGRLPDIGYLEGQCFF